MYKRQLTIGAFVLFPTLAVFILLVIRGGGGRPMWGLVTGAGVTLIVIGLNWHTSPAVCEGTAQAGGLFFFKFVPSPEGVSGDICGGAFY